MNYSKDARDAAAVTSPGGIGSHSYELGALRSALGIKQGGTFNLGALLSDRLCSQGRGDHLALIWENHTGLRKNFTFDDLRRYSDAWAHKLAELGIILATEYALCRSCA